MTFFYKYVILKLHENIFKTNNTSLILEDTNGKNNI